MGSKSSKLNSDENDVDSKIAVKKVQIQRRPKLTLNDQVKEWFPKGQNWAIGFTELSTPLEELFEISWVIKDWSKLSQIRKKLKFPDFEGGPLTKHIWGLQVKTLENTNQLVCLIKLKKNAGSSQYVEAKCDATIFSIDDSITKPGPISEDINCLKLENGNTMCIIFDDLPTQSEDDTIRLHFRILVKIPFKKDFLKHNLVTELSPAAGASNEDLASSECIKEIGSLFETKEHSDLTLVVGEVEIPVHKNILSARSPIFATMLSNPMKENAEGRVVIEDFEPEVVNAMLEFVYTGKAKAKEVSAEDLLLIAEKYQLSSELKMKCETRLISEIAINNVIRLYLFADRVSAQRLKSIAIEFISRNLDSVVKTDEYREIVKSNPEIFTEILLTISPDKDK